MSIFGGTKLKIDYTKSARLLAVFALFFIANLAPSQAMALTEQEKLNQLNKQIQETNSKLSQTKQQSRTLQGDISTFNRQIGDVQASINSTSSRIAQANREITETQNNIKKSEAELLKTREQLGDYLRISYEQGQISTLELIASSKNFSDFVDRTEYLESAQIKVKGIADDILTLKNTLETQKKSQEARKKQNEDLQREQFINKQELSSQKSERDHLLAITKGNEVEYQKMVKNLQTQHAALQAAIWTKNNTGKYVSRGRVKAGDIIGYMGNSGYSTGCHLHFETRNPSYAHKDPVNTYKDRGYLHPAPGTRVSAPYGESRYYFSNVFHTGIDYADGCRGTPIRATASGDIIQKVTGRPNTFAWSYEYGNYVKIKHDDGWYSLYAHLR